MSLSAPRAAPDVDRERELADGAAACRREAFEAVYRLYVADVLRHIQTGVVFGSSAVKGVVRVTDPLEAEEVAQEAFKEFFRQCHAGRFDARRSARNYLIGIAGYVAVNRQRRRTREIPCDPERFMLVEAAPSFAKEELTEIRAFRSTLEEESARIYDLYFDEGLGQREVGDALGLSRDQVYRRLEAIKASATRYLRKRGWFDDA